MNKLPFVMFAYNTAKQASIKMAFEATFGRKTVIPTTADISWTPKTAQGRNWANYLATHIPIIQSQALDSLRKVQTRQKALYGKCRRKAPTFKPGDFV
jgi:hypothetical protein